MKTLYQIASGTSVREEITDCIVENNNNAIESAIKQLLTVDFLGIFGTYSGFELGQSDNLGNIPLKIIYIDYFNDKEDTQWELRPVKLFS